MPREKLSFAQRTCIKKAGLALQRSGALWPGCRVGVAVSGGVDSFILLRVMKARQRITPFPFEIMALHCDPGFAPQSHAPLAPWLGREGIAGHIESCGFGPLAHSPANRSASPCFLCSMHRRKRLFELCQKYSLTHLALGHNAEDLFSTFFLNLARNGRVEGMPVRESFFGGALWLIRPLLLVEKKYIRQAARQWDLPVWPNACPSSGQTERTRMAEKALAFCEQTPNGKRCVMAALCRHELARATGRDGMAEKQ